MNNNLILHTLLPFFILFNATVTCAQTWVGNTSSNWNTASNWSTNSVPATTGVVVINNASASNQPVLAGNVTIDELNISAGTLDLNGFTLTITDEASFTGGSTGNGQLAITDIDQMQNSTFFGTIGITKTAGGTNDLAGGNTFNGTTTITNNDNSRLRFADNNGDDFNGNVTFIQGSTGALQPARDGTSTFSGNISTVGTGTAIEFGQGNGIVVLDGNGNQTLSGASAQTPEINRLTVNKSGVFTLNVPLIVSISLTLTNGYIVSGSTNFLQLNNNTVVTGAKDASHANGPVRKVGNDVFTFPVGNGIYYAPISISAPSNTAHHFTAQYFASTPVNDTALGTGLSQLSNMEYWSLQRTNGNSNVTVTLGFDATRSYVNSLTDLRVGRYNGTTWINEGNGGTTSSSVTSSSAQSNFGFFTLGSSSMANPLPVEILDFSAAPVASHIILKWSSSSEILSSHFLIEKSLNGIQWDNLGSEPAAGQSQIVREYSFTDEYPQNGWQFYRLISVDFNGSQKKSKSVSAFYSREGVELLSIFPNPAGNQLSIRVHTEIKGRNASVSVLNTNGQKIYHKVESGLSDMELDIMQYPPGNYMIEIKPEGMNALVLGFIKK